MSTETMICKNCQRRTAVGKTAYREVISYQYSSPYVINRGAYGARRVRRTVASGEVNLCAECAKNYHRASTLRVAGNRITT